MGAIDRPHLVQRMYDDDPDEPYLYVHHTPLCPTYWAFGGDSPCPPASDEYQSSDFLIYACATEEQVSNVGLEWSLEYSGTPVPDADFFWIQAWVEEIRGFDWTEYDGGVAVCPPPQGHG